MRLRRMALSAILLLGCGRVGFDRQALLDGGDAAPDAASDVSTRDTPSPVDAEVPDAVLPDGGLTEVVTALSSGLSHSCAIASGAAYCWGANISGQIGDGTTENAPSPVPVVGLPASPSLLDCGHFHTCAVVDGRAYCWGRGGAGELGDGMARDSVSPVAVVDLPAPVTSISGGQDFTCAVSGGVAYCWGVDRQGSLGRVASGNSEVPVAVEMAPEVVQISAGQDHACVVTATRTDAYCWGHNDGGALGNASAGGTERTPVRVELPPSVRRIDEITIGGWHTCARTDQGIFCWGTGSRGELGVGSTSSSNVPLPVPPFTADATTTRISVNGNPTFLDATCVVAAGGPIHCWGVNSSGRMGDGTTDDHSVPHRVGSVEGVLVATGVDHTCSASASGAVQCWGAGAQGQLGDGASADSLVPVDALVPW